MPNITTTPQPIQSLITAIQKEILTGKQKIELSIETEKTHSYWNIGKYIHIHLLNHSDRADYGEYLFRTLSQELNISARLLYRTVQFYETYPRIMEPLSYSPYSKR